MRLFAARELREGRFPFWNPLVFEGSFHLPVLYPPDLLHVLWTSPAFVSWVLTLHLPLAALTAYWLARELGAGREGAFAGGALYALAGFTLSTLNLYVFLQALALAPLVAGSFRRAALRGGRATVVAAVALALSLTTLAVEFVGQALLLGLVLGALARPSRIGVVRSRGALALGLGLAAVPLAVTLGLLPETARGAGFSPEVRLGNAVHPVVLLQAILPNLFGLPQAPAEAWWGGRFFSKGLPYFLSLYVGPLALALAATGLGSLGRALRWALLVLGGLGVWYALGEAGGLASVAAHLPLASSFRFPSKALLLPGLVLVLAASFGVDRLRREPRAWTLLSGVALAIAIVALGVAGLLAGRSPSLVAWTGVTPGYWPHVVAVATRDAAIVALLAAVTLALAFGVRRKRVGPGLAVVVVLLLAVADLVRAGAGLNGQVPVSFLRPLPETEALHLDELGEGRVFSYGLDHSPAFREFLQKGGRGLTLAGTFLRRQTLAPYSNMMDRVETAEATDLTSFVPRAPELGSDHYEPGAVGRLVPWLRNASVSRVLSLDPLDHPALERLARVPAGPPGLAIHAYRLRDPWPRAYVACRIVGSGEDPAMAPYAPGFDPGRDVALSGSPSAPSCRSGLARRTAFASGRERYEVEADGAGYLVTRDSFARGWRAWVDGVEAPVLRSNGKHRAVPLPAGARDVTLRYDPPGLWIGLLLTLLSLLVALGVWVAAPGRRAG